MEFCHIDCWNCVIVRSHSGGCLRMEQRGNSDSGTRRCAVRSYCVSAGCTGQLRVAPAGLQCYAIVYYVAVPSSVVARLNKQMQ